MRFSEIEAFLAVIQTGSLSKAADQLFITQPALSHRIQSLEAKLNTRLLLRDKGQKSIEPTSTGREFVVVAEKMYQLFLEGKRIASSPQKPLFRIATTYTLANYIMPSVYSRLISQNHPVTLELKSMHYNECYSAVENHSIDAAILSRIVPSDKASAIHICSDPMVLLCNKNNSFSETIHPSNLSAEKGIYMHWNHEYSMWHEYWFDIRQHTLQADNLIYIEKILESSDRWSIVPLSAAKIASQNRNLCYYPLHEAPPNWPIYLLTLEPQNPYTRFLVEGVRFAMDMLSRNLN